MPEEWEDLEKLRDQFLEEWEGFEEDGMEVDALEWRTERWVEENVHSQAKWNGTELFLNSLFLVFIFYFILFFSGKSRQNKREILEEREIES